MRHDDQLRNASLANSMSEVLYALERSLKYVDENLLSEALGTVWLDPEDEVTRDLAELVEVRKYLQGQYATGLGRELFSDERRLDFWSVYLMDVTTNAGVTAFKIGRSRHPLQRASELRRVHREVTPLAAFGAFTFNAETMVHDLFRCHQIGTEGELFEQHPNIVKLFGDHPLRLELAGAAKGTRAEELTTAAIDRLMSGVVR